MEKTVSTSRSVVITIIICVAVFCTTNIICKTAISIKLMNHSELSIEQMQCIENNNQSKANPLYFLKKIGEALASVETE